MWLTTPQLLGTPASALPDSPDPDALKTWSNAPVDPADLGPVIMDDASILMARIHVCVSRGIRAGIVMRSTFLVSHLHVFMMGGARR